MASPSAQIATEPTHTLTHAASIPEYLELPSTGQPVSVQVKFDDGIVFTVSDLSGRNLRWKAGGYALCVIMELDDSIIEASAISSACWFSALFTTLINGKPQQICCVPPVPGDYHIAFEIPDDSGSTTKVVDPKIVVTPIITPPSVAYRRHGRAPQ